MAFNIVDLLLLLIIVLIAMIGYARGFIRGSLDLFSWIASLVAAIRFYAPVATWLNSHGRWSQVWNRPLAFILIAFLVRCLAHALARLIVRHLPKRLDESFINRLLGIIPGVANGLITAAIVSALLLSIPLSEGLRDRARDSQLTNRLAIYTDRLETALHPVFDKAIAETLNLLTVKPESNERVELPFKVPSSRPRPDLEAAMLQLVNMERTSRGLRPLDADPELTPVARRQSADMFARGYFAHVTPEGRDPFARMREAGVQFVTAGENLALAPTLQIAHTGLMNSPGHRANILHPAFGRVGIGIMDGGIRGLMISQEFRN